MNLKAEALRLDRELAQAEFNNPVVHGQMLPSALRVPILEVALSRACEEATKAERERIIWHLRERHKDAAACEIVRGLGDADYGF